MKHIFTTRNAKALVSAFIVLSAAISACKKDDTTSNEQYAFKFKANGTQVVLNQQASLVAAFAQSGNIYNAVFNGSDGVSIAILQVYDNKAISSTTFSGYNLVGGSIVGALISYDDATGTGYMQGAGNSDATVTISEITEKTVRGTFSGTLTATGKPDIAITDGEFYVWRAN